MNWAEWKKGICHAWFRDQHFSPSLSGNRYLKVGPKRDHWAEISGNIVRYNALTPSPEVLLFRYFVCARVVSLELKFLTDSREKNLRVGSTKYMITTRLVSGFTTCACVILLFFWRFYNKGLPLKPSNISSNEEQKGWSRNPPRNETCVFFNTSHDSHFVTTLTYCESLLTLSQPRSQGLSSLPPLVVGTETLGRRLTLSLQISTQCVWRRFLCYIILWLYCYITNVLGW